MITAVVEIQTIFQPASLGILNSTILATSRICFMKLSEIQYPFLASPYSWHASLWWGHDTAWLARTRRWLTLNIRFAHV